MDVIAWLERFAKLDELIEAKKAEMDRVRELACNTVGKMDGMPHAPGVSDKVGTLAVKLITLDAELKKYSDQKDAMLDVLQMLPAAEYGVLHREYVRYMTQEQIGSDMNYCRTQVWRTKKRALKMLENILRA